MRDVHRISVTVNGRSHEAEVESRRLLVDFLREDLGLKGTHIGCEHGVCGTCTVLVDGLPVSSCCFLVAQAVGHEVTTIEGLAERAEFARLEEAFTRHAGLQCGFCIPGMLLTVNALLASGELGSEDEIKRNLSGNLCRCTGYRGIVEAVADVAGVG